MDVVETSACPNADALADFAAGRLGDDDMARVAEHLERCPLCLRAMNAPLAPDRDDFLQNLQRIHQEGVTPWSAIMATEANAGLESGPFFFNVESGPPTRDADTFFAALAESRLFDPRELTAFQAEYRAFRSADVTEFAQTLVVEDRLTEFQCRQLLRGKTRGWVLGEYIILHPLAAGGIGLVFRAWHRRMKRTVALKITPPHPARPAVNVHRFQREIEAIAQLRHPRLVTALDAGEADGVCFLVMEELQGHSLAEWVELNGPMRVLTAVDMIRQAAEGLAVAHEAGIVHRDVTPSNIWVEVFSGSTRSPNAPGVKVVDFGLAHVAEIDSMGSGFKAPEQGRDSDTADERADIYGLGCTLYFLLMGKPPYEGTTPADVHAKPLVSPREHVPERLRRVLHKMIAKSPDDRYDSMDDLIEDLDDYLAGSPRRWPAWMTWATLAAAGLIAVALAGTFWPRGKAKVTPAAKLPPPLVSPASADEAAASQRAWAKALGVPVEWTHPAGVAFRLIPPGEARVGTPSDEIEDRLRQLPPSWPRDWLRKHGDNEWHAKRVALDRAYYLGTTEVTVGQFRAFAEATRHATTAEEKGGVSYRLQLTRRHGMDLNWRAPGFSEESDDFPVAQLSVQDATAYCRWLASRDPSRVYRLPGEVEWEHACRAGSETRWHWGSDPDGFHDHVSLPAANRYAPWPVARRKANAFGLFDMSGNLAEWTSDRYDEKSPAIRGGTSIRNPVPDGVASATREPAPEAAQDFVGFRVLIELPKSNSHHP